MSWSSRLPGRAHGGRVVPAALPDPAWPGGMVPVPPAEVQASLATTVPMGPPDIVAVFRVSRPAASDPAGRLLEDVSRVAARDDWDAHLRLAMVCLLMRAGRGCRAGAPPVDEAVGYLVPSISHPGAGRRK